MQHSVGPEGIHESVSESDQDRTDLEHEAQWPYRPLRCATHEELIQSIRSHEYDDDFPGRKQRSNDGLKLGLLYMLPRVRLDLNLQ